MAPEQLAARPNLTRPTAGVAPSAAAAAGAPGTTPTAGRTWLVVAAWAAVWIPIGWGVWVTLQRAVGLFR
jgi:hypothetical protein